MARVHARLHRAQRKEAKIKPLNTSYRTKKNMSVKLWYIILVREKSLKGKRCDGKFVFA